MDELRENNRFWKARKVYNQHGDESVDTVARNTGITKSLINDLEAVCGKSRAVGYQTIGKLAQYYGVSSDFLLGLSDVPTIDADLAAVCKYTGLSECAIKKLTFTRRTGRPSFGIIVSKILEGRGWLFFCSMLDGYCRCSHELDNFLNDAIPKMQDALNSGDLEYAYQIANKMHGTWAASDDFDKMRYLLFDVTESVKDLVHEYCSDADMATRVADFTELYHKIMNDYDAFRASSDAESRVDDGNDKS